jgi:primosomal protein N' (replication factor Y) (superfamily II helicase)
LGYEQSYPQPLFLLRTVTFRIARVVLDVPLAREFDYLAIDAEISDIGRRVTVDFARKLTIGVLLDIVDHSEVSPEKLKPLEYIHRETPSLPRECLQFLQFCARYYHFPVGQVMVQALPPRLRKTLPWEPRNSSPKKRVQFSQSGAAQTHPLNEAQNQVAETILKSVRSSRFEPFLLLGITGSGKTEVYLKVAQETVKLGKKALLLVPEINLTPQLEARVQNYFKDTLVVSLHSHLSGTARVKNWLKLFDSGPLVIIGTRLAILAPLPDLGLIVVDEEHDASYKQQEGLRYSARDMAVMRAHDAHCPIVLASATPSLESLHQALRKRYQLLVLKHRADSSAQLPRMGLIDLRFFPANEGLSEPALKAIQKSTQRGEQSLIFINRRGYSPALWCTQCGWSAGCPRCSARLVLHLKAKRTRCHLCGWIQGIPRSCPECGNTELRPAGEGTQKIEHMLQDHFPTARIARVDSDSMAQKEGFATLRTALLNQELDIVVGTQMLTKGHDFPALTCVVVVNADSALFSSDFRAEERLFAQLIQVAGRAGRAKKLGHVWIQTHHPQHPLFQAILDQDFLPYAHHLIEQRQLLGFPPFVHQAMLRASGRQVEPIEAFLSFAKECAGDPEGVRIFDPVPALIAKVANKYRFHILVQATERSALHPFLSAWVEALREKPNTKVHWVVEVDPLDV